MDLRNRRFLFADQEIACGSGRMEIEGHSERKVDGAIRQFHRSVPHALLGKRTPAADTQHEYKKYCTLPHAGMLANWKCIWFPLLEGGEDAPINKMPRYLRIGAAGEVGNPARRDSDHPGRALAKVAVHSFS